MVSLSNNNSNNVNITTNNQRNVNVQSNSTSNVDANNNGNSQRARSWAVGQGLIDGEDYSAKTYAQQSKDAKDSLLNNEDFQNVTEHLTDIVAVSNDLGNIDTLADNINTYHNLLLYEELE